MNELVTLGWALLFWLVILLMGAMNGGGGYSYKPSETDPFAGRHIHVRSDPETAFDPCDECDAQNKGDRQ
jgi:hypothetical protein